VARWLISNIITVKEAEEFLSDYSGKQPFNHPVIHRICEAFKRVVSATILPDSPGYWRVEERNQGHVEHVDTGRQRTKPKGHMEWCKYGASILLTPPTAFKGGRFSYTNNGVETLSPEKHYLSAAVHTSDEFHRIEANTGGRVALLLFLPISHSEESSNASSA